MPLMCSPSSIKILLEAIHSFVCWIRFSNDRFRGFPRVLEEAMYNIKIEPSRTLDEVYEQ